MVEMEVFEALATAGGSDGSGLMLEQKTPFQTHNKYMEVPDNLVEMQKWR